MSEEFFDPISENHDWEKRHYEDILKKTNYNLRWLYIKSIICSIYKAVFLVTKIAFFQAKGKIYQKAPQRQEVTPTRLVSHTPRVSQILQKGESA